LIAWQAAKKLTLEVYRLANQFPKEEIYGLMSQTKRASISVLSNLAEGNQRTSLKDSLNFFNIAFSSLTELDCQFEVAFELGYLKEVDYKKLLEFLNKTAFLVFRLIETKKNPNSRNSPNSPNSLNGGFTLVELLVVVSIVAILSVSAILGFGYLGDDLRARQTAGFLSDTMQLEELKVLRGDLTQAKVYFAKNYLVIDEKNQGANDDLSLDTVQGSCLTQDVECALGHKAGNLTQKDGDGKTLSVKSVTAGTEPVHFYGQPDLEWNYQLTNGDGSSNTLRFVQFNLQGGNLKNDFWITSITSGVSAIEVDSPYGKKRFFDSAGEPLVVDRPVTLEVGNAKIHEDATVLQTTTFQ
jgi:four helix bundle protein